MSLNTQGLSFGYQRDEWVLHDLTLNFAKAPVVGVVGANGCGKSTLFQLLLGLLKPSKGQVRWQNTPLSYSKAALLAHRQRVSLVFQEPDQQIFHTDIVSDVGFSLKNLGVDGAQVQRRTASALRMVDGLGFIDRPVQYLSFGQKKRVAIAGALVLNSDYLLLDEPTAGLDPSGVRHMKSVIDRVVKQGKHVVISSHDIDLIYQVCDYVYVLANGRVALQGAPESVFLDRQSIEQIGLEQPWLVKLHVELGYPLYRNEQQLFAAAHNAGHQANA